MCFLSDKQTVFSFYVPVTDSVWQSFWDKLFFVFIFGYPAVFLVVLEVSVVIVLQQSYSIFQRFVGMVAGFSLPDCSVVVPVVLSAYTCSGPWKPGSWCRLSKAHGLLGKPKGGWEFGMGRDWGGLRRGRSVHEQPGAKVDGIAPHKRRDSK
jgi:hypothetical protein